MNGVVDDSLRALIEVPVRATRDATTECPTVWIDTACNGELVIPREENLGLGLRKSSTTQATLADGRIVESETYACHLDWFGKSLRTQVIANDGAFPLLGTMLLAGRSLHVDHVLVSVTVD